ncbi:PREDICTED: maternal protein tudor isoform X2 [Wasmannia auropunctata]|uniref:maternal protein tudor isoform X2 n=1 Tax=Wasmannia auropunctata TaxID=64793 RepID=UPI0005F09C4E|nr:PREDICTED: maternal protein tudor isoform X2 [Wasmannia auropunctata]
MLPERANMTQQPSSSECFIFVTHVEPDDIYLKIWGQVDKQAATAIEHYIYPLIDQFNQGYGCPTKASRLIPGTLCCARFQTEGYYRAKILNVRPDGMIVVHFIDYGNVEVLLPNDIHLLDNIRGAEPLQAYGPMAGEFTLLNVLPVNGVWENRTIETIKKTICYNEYRALIQTLNNHRLIKLWCNNEDLSELLVKERIALPATLQDMFRPPKQMLQSRMLQQMPYQQQNKGNINNFAAMPMVQNPNMNHNANVQGLYHKTYSPDVNQPKHVAPAPIMQHPPPPVHQEALVFKSRVLDVGSHHEVLISHVEDGPHKFSVQVETARDILTQLMTEINNHPKQPLQEPPLPGSVCLGRYNDTGGERVLCRAVVMSVMEHKCKLYYVDFGHTEILPYTDIFQLPPKYINPKVLSIRFTLSGLKELIISQEMKEYFKQLVYRRLLVLHVRPPEGPPLIQYGDLYENGVNVKDMLKKAFPAPVAAVPITYSYPQLRRLAKDFQEVVHVSYVESCKKFFVQLDSGIKSLESIMAGLTQYAKTASTLNIAQLKAGLPCAALYESQWYRAQILGIVGDKVKVVYVDYGNEEVLPVISIRAIHDDLVTKLPAQAVKCALNGYEVLSLDQEDSNRFERLTLEKRFYMKVVAAQPNGLLVDLYEFDTMRSVHPQLLNNLFCDKENATTCSRNEEVQHPVKTMNEFQSEDKDRYSKKSNMESWRNQNAKPFQENKSNWKSEWSQEKQYDNKRERTSFHRDGSQNDRFRDRPTNNRFDRDKSFNKYDEGDVNTSFNRGNRGPPRDSGNRFAGNERRHNRNNSFDKANSDKDSDTSSKSNDRRGKGGFKRNGFNDNRGGSRDGGTPGRWQTTNWDDKKPAYKANYRNDKFNGDNDNSSNNFRKEDNTNEVLFNQTTDSEPWDTNGANKRLQDNITAVGGKSQLSLKKIDITLGSVKNCEVVFINSPSDFFVQLSPDCLELDSIMENIAATYENGGETMQASEIQIGTYCVAQYSEDLKWYRAVIKSVEENSATVEFVDYGNTELVDLTNIKVILEDFLKLPMQAVRCKLLGLTNTGNEEEQHAIFVEKADGKPLQVEFVSEKDEMYEVQLCEVVDGVPNTNYINEEFCTIADLTKAKQVATSKDTFETTTVEIKTATDYASPDFKWQTILFESESKHNIVVTWFINPNKLYCQLLSKEAEFKAMMSEIQKTYAGRKPVTYKLEIGSAVIAIFSEDKALYRAEVISIDTRKDAYRIQYIDFGNCATVHRHNIYPVEKKFMQLPKLAVQCSLKDISNSNWLKVDNNALDSYFNADKYECIFHSFKDDQYIISLNNNGQDVGDMLVQQNLAITTAVETTGATETSNVEEKKVGEVERVDISLLSGQTLKMRISSVESTVKFYIQLPSATKCENIVNQYMTDKDTEALALPGELAVMQNQALECSLRDAPPDTYKRLKELEGKEVLIHVEEVYSSRLIVKLYDLLGNGIMNTEETTSPVCAMPILSSTHSVSVSYADHPTNIWLQRYADVEIETKLSEDLQQYYASSGQKLEPAMHLLCATKYSDDGQWYRGKIISLTETTAYVSYIDYGNTEEVALDSIMILEPQFYEPHQLAIKVSLSVSLTGTEDEQKEILQTHLMNKELVAVFYNVHEKWIVDLAENGEKLSDKFRSLNLVREEQTVSEPASQPASDKHETATPETATPDRFDVCISHVDSPSQFWLHRMDKITHLNEKQEQLQLEVSEFSAIDGIPEEGALCVAVYSIDDLWYRAEVLDADEDITTVRFVDYGNTDVIDNKTSNIRQIPDAWKSLETFALKCRLDVIPVDTEDWSELTCERFKNLVTSVESLQALVVADTTPKRVELFINNKSVSETLVEEKHAIIINIEQEPVDEIVDLELDPHSAFVCHINSPSEFWVQEEKSVADLEVMADRFMVADMFPKIDDINEGLLCVAKYPEDEQWYRARVVSHDENGTQVIYIDYGNSAISTEIRAIPEDLASISPLSRKCCLELPSQVEEWSEQAREEFVKLAADGATIFILDVLKEQETSLVKLTLDGQNVADMLGNLCERSSSPVIEERLPPLGEENSPNVVVSHINSPNEFWIQAESSISELEVMSDRLRDAESFLVLNSFDVGTVCAARYPEDGYWYRAKIIARCKESMEVLYMDYGNSAVTEELRVLPEDIVNIPILSKRCALEKPSSVVAWSEKACDKFKELAAEGATMFQFEILDENDPMHVRLSLNGTNVIDLLSECEDIPKVTETKDTAPDVEKQETVLHEPEQPELINDKKATEEPILSQTDNLECIDQMEKPLQINGAVFNGSIKNSDINGEDQQIASEIEENVDNGSEVAVDECTLTLKKNVSTEMDKNTDVVANETISSASAAIVSCHQMTSSGVMELSVDEIIEHMIKDATDELETQKIDNADSLNANETQQSVATNANEPEQQELHSQVHRYQTEIDNEVLDAQILETVDTKRDIEDLESNKILSVTTEAQPQGIVQLDASQGMQEEQGVTKMENGAIASSKSILEMESCLLSREQVNLEQIQGQGLTESEIIPESTNNNGLETQSENADSSSAKLLPAVKTDPIEQRSPSEVQSKDKDELISEGEPSKRSETETKRCLTPKTSHSEKIVAAVVNPYVQPVLDSANETDEVLSVSVEDNIPKYMV